MTPRDQALCAMFDADRDHIATMRAIVARMAEPRTTTARLANYERAGVPSEVITAWDADVLALDAKRRARRKRRAA